MVQPIGYIRQLSAVGSSVLSLHDFVVNGLELAAGAFDRYLSVYVARSRIDDLGPRRGPHSHYRVTKSNSLSTMFGRLLCLGVEPKLVRCQCSLPVTPAGQRSAHTMN